MTYFKRFLMVLLLMLPVAAFAAVVNPVGNGTNAWPLHVMGNGSTIASVLESIKLVLNPKFGGGSFRMLLLFISMTGFCILAIQAGFNPGQNLLKMFSYILVVWVVTYSTTSLTANVMVQDKVTQKDFVVTDVPAIVALPASIVSEVGHWLTETIQQAYSTPDDFSLTKGGFDLFNKMKQDMGKYVITNQNLKQSMTAYITDCAVPALARGSPTGNELLRSPNLVKTLGNPNAASQVLLTRYFYQQDGLPPTSTIITCKEAYDKLVPALNEHATQLMTASSAQWSATGTLTPFANVMQSWMEMGHVGANANDGASYSKPADLVLQNSLINTMAGDFRQAAIQSGNNEVLMGQSITQAEQSQKSGWVTSAMVFQNMMGYVYTTLQAFIFAIVPIMVVAFLIPGLGKKIFVNYGQVLIWLTLWEPMLSIVNYLVTLFGVQDMQTIMATGNSGFSMANSYLVTEQGNNLTIAASFLATMVPLLCWGLVNGAMAFTEFISHGIGSSFAMQAGAQAATGNVSLNSMGMNNLSSNKFDNSQKATVGNQTVMAFENAGNFLSQNNGGGHAADSNGSNITSKFNLSDQTQTGVSKSDGATAGRSAKDGVSNDKAKGGKAENGSSASSQFQTSRTVGDEEARSASQASAFTKKGDKSHALKKDETGSVLASKAVQIGIDSGVDMKGGKGPGGAAGSGAGAGAAGGPGGPGGKAGGLGANAGARMGGNAQQAANAALVAAQSDATSTSQATEEKFGLTKSGAHKNAQQKTGTLAEGKQQSLSSYRSQGAAQTNGADNTYATNHGYTHNEGSTRTFSKSLDWNAAVTDDMIAVALASENDGISLEQRQADMDRFYGKTSNAIDAHAGAAAAAFNGLASAGTGGIDKGVLDKAGAAPSTALVAGMGDTLKALNGGFDKEVGVLKSDISKRLSDFENAGANLDSNLLSITPGDATHPTTYQNSTLAPLVVGGSAAVGAYNATVGALAGARAASAAAPVAGTAAAAGGTQAAAGASLASTVGVSTAAVTGGFLAGGALGVYLDEHSSTARSFYSWMDKSVWAPLEDRWGVHPQAKLPSGVQERVDELKKSGAWPKD